MAEAGFAAPRICWRYRDSVSAGGLRELVEAVEETSSFLRASGLDCRNKGEKQRREQKDRKALGKPFEREPPVP